MRTNKEMENMIPLFAQAEGDAYWPEGTTASGVLTDYLNETKSTEREDLLLDLKNHCIKAWALLPYAEVNPQFGMFVACAITVVWMLGDEALLVRIVKIEPDIDGIVEKLLVIVDAYRETVGDLVSESEEYKRGKDVSSKPTP